jgi:hypothetical protein
MKHQSITKHFLEIRFQPLPSILDKRGAITEALLNEIFDVWIVDQNRINIASTSNKNISCYVSYANYGLISETPTTSELFIEQAQELIKKLWTIIPPSRTQRFGLRTYQISPDKRGLEDLVELYKNKYLSIPEKRLASFNGTVVDVGIALNFTDEANNKFNVNTGAMLRDQAKQYFSDESLLSEVGIFSDTDFFNENPSQLGSYRQRDFLELVKRGVEKAEEVQKVVTEILNDKSSK